MLVEINLLPRKERSTPTFLIAAIFLVIFLLLIISFFYWRNLMVENQISSLRNRISLTERVIVEEQGKVQGIQESDSIERLQKSIEWGNANTIKTVPVMRQLISLLPDRGFLQSFSYSGIDGIKLLVQFDTSREAAYYLNRLNEADWVEEAKLKELISQEFTSEENGTFTEPYANEYPEDQYLPRYIAEYQIQLNASKIKELPDTDPALLQEGAGQ